jgi:alkylation response protein AidB-like acyl-CoA dehydrogenase
MAARGEHVTAPLSDDERELLVETVRDFAWKEVAPLVRDYDRDEKLPRHLLERLRELHLVGGTVEPEYGGLGLDHVSYAAILEEMATVCHIVAVLMSMPSSLVGSGIRKFGTEDQRQTYLAPLARGEVFGGAGVTEPHSGTDVAAMETTCVRVDGGYVLRGQKIWISNLDIASFFVTFATLDPQRGRDAICAFIVPADAEGLTKKPFENKLGFRPISTGELIFDECFVRTENLLGDEGDGMRVAMAAVENGRLSVAARATGIVRACLRESLQYARERIVFGQPIGQFQIVQSHLSDMLVGARTAHLLVRHLAEERDAGRPVRQLASMAKMYASDVAMRSATAAMQVHGAYGASDEYPVGRYFRDAKFFQIVEGSNDVHRALIAEIELGYRPNR